ncbi:MAG: hypothetical protein ISS17_09560 [Bacteroidales bacterium]|nr:hypothetical protein [Bacteroidales bacterium]
MPVIANGQELSVRSGIYDFTNLTTREFYVIAPTLLVGYDFWTLSRLSFQVTSGISYNTAKYNADRHHLIMIPLFLTASYNLPNPHARLFPVIGGGLSMMLKMDQNASLSKVHYGLTYGLQASGGLRYALRPGLLLTFDIACHIFVPFTTEETNINGFLYTLGLRIPLSIHK